MNCCVCTSNWLRVAAGWWWMRRSWIPHPSTASHPPANPPAPSLFLPLGKFFGLAGARVGFVLAEKNILQPLAELLGPWPIATPSRHVATLALRDMAWQDATRKALQVAAQRLVDLLSAHGLSPDGGSSLFQWVCCADAANVHEQLAQQGILTRLFDTPSSVRFGLPRDEAQWARLSDSLGELKR